MRLVLRRLLMAVKSVLTVLKVLVMVVMIRGSA